MNLWAQIWQSQTELKSASSENIIVYPKKRKKEYLEWIINFNNINLSLNFEGIS